jgi:anti-anti-sigma factor
MTTTIPMAPELPPIAGAHVSKLRVRMERRGRVLVLHLVGQLDVYTIAGLRRRLERLDRTARALVVDVSHVDFVDSSGLGTLMFLQTAFASRDARTAIVGAGPDLEKALGIAGLGREILHAESIRDACQQLLGEPDRDV